MTEQATVTPIKSRRGFAAMDPALHRKIAGMGGKAAHAKGTAHEFTVEEAREAGRKGGVAMGMNREHMAAIGRKGGRNSQRNRQKTAATPAPTTTTQPPQQQS